MRLLSLRDAAAELRSAAHAGILVPFIGAGMSRPTCNGWLEFVNALNVLLGVQADASHANNDTLYKFADRTALALRLLETERQLTILRCALLRHDLQDTNVPIPEQTRSLAKFYWPLVISTNYDNLYISALGSAPVKVLGRSPHHCERIVQSLDVSRPRILWAIQGYVGGFKVDTHSTQPYTLDSEQTYMSDSDRAMLLEEVVIGHQQYQQAAAQSPAFRRTFSEVFRRRSLLFLGSGLSETYFVNLFSEILLNYGPSPHQHYAFICKDEANQFDIQFLQVRLGITPVVYGEDYSSLPDALSSILPKPIDSKYDTRQTVTALSGFSYWIPRASVSKGSIHFQLCFSELRQPLAGQAVVLSAGRLANGMPALGNMGKSFLGIFRRTFPSFGIHMQKWEAVRSSRSLFRLVSDGGRFPVFALIAREPVTAKRDLMSIKRTTVEALNILEDLGEFEHVSMGILAAGDPSFAHPTFPFMGQLAGIREFTASELGAPQNKALTSLRIDIVDLSVWRPILSGRLPVRELLSSDLVRVFVRIQYDLERWDSFAISVPFHYTVRDVLSLYQILDEGVAITLYPSAIAQKSDPFSAPIFPLMTIQVNGRHFGERTNQ